jgi:hypothetical protein
VYAFKPVRPTGFQYKVLATYDATVLTGVTTNNWSSCSKLVPPKDWETAWNADGAPSYGERQTDYFAAGVTLRNLHEQLCRDAFERIRTAVASNSTAAVMNAKPFAFKHSDKNQVTAIITAEGDCKISHSWQPAMFI